MARIALNVKTSAGAGTASAVAHLRAEKSVHFAAVTGCSLQLQGSNDNVNWANLGDAITSDSIVSLAVPLEFVRIYTTTYTGTPVVTLMGHVLHG